MSDTLIGKRIGKYVIKEKLGSGGMAEVYKGLQENLDRYVAIKLMHAFLVTEQDFLHRFKREARAMAALNHPNIVGVYDFDVYGENSYYLVMEYISGGTLKQKLQEMAERDEKMPLTQAVKIATEVADALAYAHRRNMVHRDIKPANIMIDEETGKAILTDFGIVKMIGNQSMAFTATGALIGTPAYMSPEQALGKPGDERVDIYSLGVLLFQMITSQLPFDADTPLAVVMKHVNDPTPMPMTFNPDVPPGLQEVVMKAMAKVPEDRYQTAAEMATALRAVNLSVGDRAAAVAPPPSTPTPTSRTVVGATEITEPEPEPEAETAVADAAPLKKRPAWLFPILGIAAIGVIALILSVSGVLGGGSQDSTPTVPAVAEAENTDTPEPTEGATTGPTATTPPNVAATELAQIVADLTREAIATETNTPTRTPTPTATSTPTTNATAAFLANCEPGLELVSVVRSGFATNAVTVGFGFPARWELRNSGTCPWAEDFTWQYVEGEEFDYEDGPIPLGETVPAGGTIELTADFSAPDTPGTYESTWQLFDGDTPFGEPATFEFRALPLATNTPRPTNTPPATATSESPTVSGTVDWIYTIGTCDYPGGSADWRCAVTITPYIDGSDAVGQFTVFVFDLPSGQAAEYRGTGPFTHFVRARRCATYNHEVRIIDDVTGTEISEQLFIDPDNHFPGGCTLP